MKSADDGDYSEVLITDLCDLGSVLKSSNFTCEVHTYHVTCKMYKHIVWSLYASVTTNELSYIRTLHYFLCTLLLVHMYSA